MKKTTIFCIFSILLLIAVSSVIADPDAPEWVDYYGTITLNGNPAPVGTVVEAYDPDGIMCGTFTVATAGSYGFIHVYRDDIDTPGTDEGADPGDTITFKINGLDAVPTVISGNLTWTSNGDNSEVNLASGSTQNIAFSITSYPQDTLGAPGHTYRFYVGLQNDGNGLDFYGVNAAADSSGNDAWSVMNQDTLSYADPGNTTTVWFDITLPVFGGGSDTVHVVHYAVYSEIDNTVSASDSVIITKSITDVNDNPWADLPNSIDLYQNYPNPFNPVTSIAFNLPRQSNVQLEIINIQGQVVDVVNNGTLPAGYHEFEYDASSLSSGVYFYRLITDDSSQSRKMVLLK